MCLNNTVQPTNNNTTEFDNENSTQRMGFLTRLLCCIRPLNNADSLQLTEENLYVLHPRETDQDFALRILKQLKDSEMPGTNEVVHKEN